MSLFEKKKKLIQDLIRSGYVKNELYIEAFMKVPREKFVWPGYEEEAYIDTPLPLGNTGQTISAPHMCLYLLEALEVKVGDVVLEIGAGSGYQAALLAECVAPSTVDRSLWGHVYTIEIRPELAKFAKENIAKTGYSDRVTVIQGNGSLGYPPNDPTERYDKILLTASAPDVPPPLLKQLKKGGILVAPIGKGYFQELIKVVKLESGAYKRMFLTTVAFVPLRGMYGWREYDEEL